MRKIFLTCFVLCTCLFASAEVVPLSKAKARAEQQMRQVAPSRTPSLQLLSDRPATGTKSLDDAPEYFIFTDTRGGFVIAAGDDAVPAILGYSPSGTISAEGMPGNLRGWLDMWIRIIEGARLQGAAPHQSAGPYHATGSRLLETAKWDQTDPYNLLCIEMDGKRAVTGCTATATAIVMRYHRWPDKGTGTLPSYKVADEDSGKTYTIPEVSLGTPYDWDQMPTAKYDGMWSAEQKDEVARLMRDCGVMIQSQYAPGGTGAYIEDVGPAMVKYMQYDAGYQTDSKALYDDVSEWVARLEDNIDRIGPVLYGAQTDGTSAAGHAFVIDGYDEQDNLHINWGWGGTGDGFFAMPAFKEYTRGHQAVLGLRKDAGGKAPEDLRVFNIGLTSPATTFAPGTPFTIVCKNLGNFGPADFSGELRFARYDRYDRFVDYISEASPLSLAAGNAIQFSEDACAVTSEVRAGDYVRLLFRSEQTPDWTPVRYDHEKMVIGKLPVGDTVFLDEIVSIQYTSSTGILTVTFSDQASRELRTSGGATVTACVSDDGDVMTVDANQLPAATYILHLQRGTQIQDIKLVFGRK